MSRKNEACRRYTANGDPLPTMAELRQFNIAADRWLVNRGEHVGDMRMNIKRDYKLNRAEKGAAQ